MPWNRPLIVCLLVALLVLAWWRMHPEKGEVRRSRLIMGTVVEIVVEGEDSDLLNAALDEAFAEIERLDKLLSSYRQDSDVSLLSQSRTGRQVAPETAEVIALGLEVAHRSDGAFDLTLGQLKALWGMDGETPRVPEAQALSSALTSVGPKALVLDGRQVRKQAAHLQVDLGGVAKGFAVDRAVAILRQRGVTGAAVNAGGDMYLLGQRSTRPWRIGIQHPRQEETVLETGEVSDRAGVSSGDYERFFEEDGQRYHHIFDPRSGFPARGCQSVTVITDSVALGDALATAVFVLGPAAGLVLLERYPRSEGLIVAADGTRHASPGWEDIQAKP